MNETYDFKVDWCKICGQGWVTIVKDKVTNQFTVMCAECENEWDHPLHAQSNIKTKEVSEEHLVVNPSKEEIQENGWDVYIIRE
ncbi:hypothetical protein QWY16_11195 [Planococcus shenhongbingii]|uniref:hypothetical protein n=1 Tax=Planococcus shenhongbingii TaxID=3058398 RepID=UPI00260618A8|nr:hypothetical protein [Planococcus sp. N016]WKA57070.1 hypothetical protein QWY16_11195 [Planococcus sp. N016]